MNEGRSVLQNPPAPRMSTTPLKYRSTLDLSHAFSLEINVAGKEGNTLPVKMKNGGTSFGETVDIDKTLRHVASPRNEEPNPSDDLCKTYLGLVLRTGSRSSKELGRTTLKPSEFTKPASGTDLECRQLKMVAVRNIHACYYAELAVKIQSEF